MTSPKSQILIYDELDSADQARVDAYLQSHPQDRHLLYEGRRLRSGLAASAMPHLSDDLLAEVVTSRALDYGGQSEAMAELATRIDHACLQDPVLAQRYAELERRLNSITADLPSAEEKYAEVLSKVGASEGVQSRHIKRTQRSPAPDRAHAGTRRLPRRTVYIAAVVLACVAALTVLISETTQPAYQQVAALDGISERYAPPLLRGGDATVQPNGLASALDAIAASRTTTLGLFPRYDEDHLRTAQEQLMVAIASSTLDSQSVANAQVINALVYLHLGEVATARRILEAVASDEGPAALDARQILSKMDQRGLLTDPAH